MLSEQRSLEQLDGRDWGLPENAPTPVVERCLRLRKLSLKALGPGDVQFLISQQVGLHYLVPEALARIAENTLLEAELYPGDLLTALLRIDKDYWSKNATELSWLKQILTVFVEEHGMIVADCQKFLDTN